MIKIKSDFYSNGVRCDGDLLLPDDVKKTPIIIMAHGLSAQKDHGLMPYTKRFLKLGIAVYLFDYRTFGKSDGEYRQMINPFHHVEDWQNAIKHIRSLDQIDTQRIALWGSSFSGGHVLTVSGQDPHIAAVSAQVPFVSNSVLMSTHINKNTMKAVLFGFYDKLRSLFRLSPHYSPVIARTGEYGLMNTAESYDGFLSLVPDNSNWENKYASRAIFSMIRYNPSHFAKNITAPVLIVAGKHDSLIPISAIRECANKISDIELKEVNCNHFQPYKNEYFDQIVEWQSRFFAEKLLSK